MSCRKRQKTSPDKTSDCFDSLPDDLVLSILCKLSSTATSPSDFISVLITCKRLNSLGLHSLVLSKASHKTFSVKAKNWCDSLHRFLKHCADAGNIEACYTLGLIRFYCLQNRGSGASLMAKAAMNSHAPALYSLAVIQFNGSGGTKNDKDLRAGVALCARAAFLGHIDALRELGHCLQDGYGVKQNFMSEWFDIRGGFPSAGMRLCSQSGCGRPETRRHEFRRCSVCGVVNYCSRACQALDWKFRHKAECAPVERWLDDDDEDVAGENDGGDDGVMMVDS
ncbi:F-box protein [Glycine soja]|nr:F-box protein [Glycine soja]